MRKIFLFSAVLSLFLLVPASITRAQVTKTLNGVVRYESGISKTTFETPNGNIVTSLPQSMTGTIIIGTVVAEPAGKTEKEKSRNLQELVKLVVNLDGQKIPVTATPTNFDWLTHLDRQQRTPIELLNVSGYKLAELSLPPVISAPATVAVQTGIVPHLTTPSNVMVKEDLLNVYTDQQFSSGEKFVLTDSKGQQFTVTPICLSSQQAVMQVPEGVVPGSCTIREEVTNQQPNSNNVLSADFKMIDIDLSSPNTNLRSGQTSSVTVVVHESTGSGTTANENTQQVLNIDLRNLEPNTVSMVGGNLQRIRFPVSDNLQGAAAWQATRTITGIKPGSFSVSATLHEDYSTSNDPFRPQLNVLKTREDFIAWAIALKKDLMEYASVQNNDAMGQAVKSNTKRAIDNMPVCKSPEQLDECKAVIYSLIRPLNVPMGAASTWLSSFEAFKTSVASAVSGLPENTILTDWDIVRNGLDFLERLSYSSNDPSLTQEVTNARQLVDRIDKSGETKENLNQLNQALSTLSSIPDQKQAYMPGPDESKYVSAYYTKHADKEGPYKSLEVPNTWDHEDREVPYKSRYKPYGQEHEYREGPDKSTYVDKDHKHAGEGTHDKSKRYPANQNHEEREGPDKTKYIPKSWKHVAMEGPNKSKRYSKYQMHADKEGPYQSKLLTDGFWHFDKEGPDKSNYYFGGGGNHEDKETPDKSKFLYHSSESKNISKYVPYKLPVHIETDGPFKSTYKLPQY